MAKKALGKGLGAIISTSATPVEDIERNLSEDAGRIINLPLDSVTPNPDQPRTHFDESEIQDLAASINSVGLLQPIIVRKKDQGYLVVAGERRLRACRLAGLKKIKAIVVQADEERNLTLALIENIQRADLDPIEEARAYRALVDRFKLRQQDVAEKVGRDRATITNSLRLLNLPDEIQEGISDGSISTGHAKVILSVSGRSRQTDLFREIVKKGLSVRALEQIVKDRKAGNEDPEKRPAPRKDAHIRQLEDELISALGTKVEIRHSGSGGKIEISYYSLDDFDRILEIIKG